MSEVTKLAQAGVERWSLELADARLLGCLEEWECRECVGVTNASARRQKEILYALNRLGLNESFKKESHCLLLHAGRASHIECHSRSQKTDEITYIASE